MYLVELQAKPGPKAEDVEGIAGAYVNCLINFALKDGAELLARHYVQEAGWIVTKVDEVSWVGQENYEGEEALRYFQEAEEDGVSIVFHTYPIDENHEPHN